MRLPYRPGRGQVRLGRRRMEVKVYFSFFATALVAVALSGVLCTAAFPQTDGADTWRSDELGITLTYPDNWYINEKPETAEVPCLVEVKTGGVEKPDPFGAFIMPVFIGQGYFEDIGSLAEAWRDTSKSDWNEFTPLSETSTTTADGHPALEMRYTVTDEMDYRIQWAVLLVLTEEKNKAWVLGYCARDLFDTYYKDAENIFSLAEFDD